MGFVELRIQRRENEPPEVLKVGGDSSTIHQLKQLFRMFQEKYGVIEIVLPFDKIEIVWPHEKH